MYFVACQSPTNPNPCHKISSPIATVPVEVFHGIVRQVVQKALRPSCADEAYFGVLTDLRLVCTWWAQAIEQNPEFWQRLSLQSSEELVHLRLKRARDWPLDICGTVKLASVLNLALGEALRWRSVDVCIDSQPNLDLLLSRPAPLLESLAVHSPSPGILTPSPAFFNEAAPRLQAVKLTGCPLPWSSSTLCGLRELSICSIRAPIRYTTFLNVLKRSPELVHLDISSTPFEVPLPDAQPVRIALHKLRSFKLESLNRSAMQTLASSIDVPTLANCRYATRLEEDDILEQVLSPLLQRLEVLAELPRDLPWTLRMAMGGPTRWTKSGWDDSLAGEATLEYQGINPHGTTLIVVTSNPSRHTDIFAYFVERLARMVPKTIPPSLHFVRLQSMDRNPNILVHVDRHFPLARDIVIQETSHQSRVRALGRLFIPPAENSRLFRRLSSLTLQAPYHDDWVAWLAARRTLQRNSTVMSPPPVETLRVKDGMIAPRKVDVLKSIVPNLILENVKVE